MISQTLADRLEAAHARGESRFVDDLPLAEGTLHAAVFPAPCAKGLIRSLDLKKAERAAGVVSIFTAADIPGENQIGNIIADESLLADGEFHYAGQPLALVVARSAEEARRSIRLIELAFERLPAVFDPRLACAAGDLILPPRTFVLGDVESAWAHCAHRVSGRVDSGGQEHLYLETQAALAVPSERGRMVVFSSTQSPSVVQKTIARVLGISQNQVEVDVRRLGGGFGGKEDQATAWAALAALAAWKLGRPVKLALRRHEDMRFTGKRHPYSSDFAIGLDARGKILAYEVTFYQNAGAAADLSPAILERTLFHASNSYFIPNVRATAYCCRTNLPPYTAFRGFGAPQAMLVMEAAIVEAARAMGTDVAVIQEKNLLREGDVFPYGQEAKNCRALRCWDQAVKVNDLQGRRFRVGEFNRSHRWEKKGLAVMPICFGISFTSTPLNQAGALVHVYTDGSVSVSTAAVEMGQGVNAKVRLVVARTLGISPQRVRVESTNTMRVANMSPTAASVGADLNGRAAQMACQMIRGRLLRVAAEELGLSPTENLAIVDEAVSHDRGGKSDLSWERLIRAAFSRRVNLSAQAHYATPGIHFDRQREKGRPFAYHVFGTAVCEANLDCLRGIARVERVSVVHDLGRSIDPLVDRGQMEGGIVQGIGWLTMEELLYSPEGLLISDSFGTYKVPDLRSVPDEIDLHFLEDADNPEAVMGSKAVGEPPFMYGIGAYFAIREAMRAFRPDKPLAITTPLTSEKILLFLHG